MNTNSSNNNSNNKLDLNLLEKIGIQNFTAINGSHHKCENFKRPLINNGDNELVSKRIAYNTQKSREQEKNDASAAEERIECISRSYLEILNSIGEDPNRQGLLKTPQRAARALMHFTKGYEEVLQGYTI
jgi:hypothetical protein